jgi:hypothetical protein
MKNINMKTKLITIAAVSLACLATYALGFNHAEQLFKWFPVIER